MKIRSTTPNAKTEKDRIALLHGMLDLLILGTLVLGSNRFKQHAEDTLLVDHALSAAAMARRAGVDLW